MRRVSSTATFFYKRIFPVLWFGFLALFLLVPLVWGSRSGRYPPLLFMIVPIAMAVFGYAIMKAVVFDLVDEVMDGGDVLIVRNGEQEDRIPFHEIMNVSYSSFTSPPRVTLLLRTPSVFGKKVSFCAPLRLIPSATNPMVDELITRIDAARRA